MPIFNGLAVIKNEGNFYKEEIHHFLNPQSLENRYISADIALRNSDIYAIVSQLSGDLASAKLVANKPRVQNILNNPSSTASAYGFWQSMFAQLLLSGEAFAYRWRNINGMDVRWEYLRPSQVSVLEPELGTLIYTISFNDPTVSVKQAVPSGDVIHLRLLSTNGGKVAISPLSALGVELEITDSANRLTLNALEQSVMAPGVLKVTKGGLLDADEKAARSKQFVNQVKRSNNGPIVIDDLEQYTPLEIKSDVAQLLKQTDWTSKQFAKVFGIPDSYVNGQGDQQSSLDQIKGMYANALNRYLQAIVSELDSKLNATIHADIRPAIDPLGDIYATNLSTIAKNGVLASNQIVWLLQQTGYFPQDMPEAKEIMTPKGGEQQDVDSNERHHFK